MCVFVHAEGFDGDVLRRTRCCLDGWRRGILGQVDVECHTIGVIEDGEFHRTLAVVVLGRRDPSIGSSPLPNTHNLNFRKDGIDRQRKRLK